MSINVGSFVFSQLNISIEEPVTVDDLKLELTLKSCGQLHLVGDDDGGIHHHAVLN
jgi:hypothetical protein